MEAEVDELEGRIEQIARRTRQQDLAAVAGASDSRAAVDVDPHVALVTDHRLARVQAHANTDRSPLERILRSLCACDRIRGASECDEEGVTLRVHLDAAVLCKRVPKHAPVLGEDVRVAVAEFVQEPCGPFNIGEEEGDCS